MIRKLFILSLLFILLLALGGVVGIRTLGGAFEHEPEEMAGGLSVDSKAMLEKAYAGLDENSIWDYHTHIVAQVRFPVTRG